MPTKYIDMVGVELEGGWDVPPKPDIVHDDSITLRGVPFIGEVQSDPGDLEYVSKFIKENCPDYVDPSCGFHIHISLKSTNAYLTLTDKKFHTFLKTRSKAWAENRGLKPTHRFYKRLSGENKHCQDLFRPEEQIVCKTKDEARKKSGTNPDDQIRRTHLNYCYGIHRTLENRLFPCDTNPEILISAVELFIEVVEEYLDENKLEAVVYPKVTIKMSELED